MTFVWIVDIIAETFSDAAKAHAMITSQIPGTVIHDLTQICSSRLAPEWIAEVACTQTRVRTLARGHKHTGAHRMLAGT